MAELTSSTAGRSFRFPLKPLLYLAFFIALALVPYIADAVGQPFYVRLVLRMMVFALMAVSLNLILGYGGLVSFGHAMFVGSAAYVVAILNDHAFQGMDIEFLGLAFDGSLNAALTWPLAIGFSAVLAAVVGFIALRTSGLYFIMITLALAQMAYFVTVSLDDYGGVDGLQLMGGQTLLGLDLDHRQTVYFLALGALALALLVCRSVVRSRFGLVLRASKQNEIRLLAVGVPVLQYRLVAFVISGTLAGLAGVLLATSQAFVSPADLSWMRSGELIVMVVLGGMGSLFGPVAGAFFYLAAEFLLGGLTEYWHMLMGPLLIVIVLYARGGLAGLLGAGNTPQKEQAHE